MRRGRPGLVGTMARTAVVAGTASAVSGNVHRRQQARWQGDQDEAAQAEYEAQVAAQAGQSQAQVAALQQQVAQLQSAPPADDMMSKLKQLADLNAAGILSDEEFAAAKAKVLAG